jgi:8-oxo-dGTP pyrophosphatase MutT (NUDIX family)
METSLPSLETVLISDDEAAAMQVHGSTEAAVLLPIENWSTQPSLVFTERRADLNKHAGEISFPGGRRDPEDLHAKATALREAQEEIALDPKRVEVVGALPPVGTFVTSFRILPYVGLIESGADLRPNPSEVAAILNFDLEALAAAYEMRRLVRRGVPFRTPTFEMERHLIWGATARILADFLKRLELLP